MRKPERPQRLKTSASDACDRPSLRLDPERVAHSPPLTARTGPSGTRLALQVVDRDLRDSQDRRDWWAVQWQTAAKVLELIKSERAAQIVDDDGDNSAKIEMLGQLMFGEDWKAEGKAEGES